MRTSAGLGGDRVRLTLAGRPPDGGLALGVPRRTALLAGYTAATIVLGLGAVLLATAGAVAVGRSGVQPGDRDPGPRSRHRRRGRRRRVDAVRPGGWDADPARPGRARHPDASISRSSRPRRSSAARSRAPGWPLVATIERREVREVPWYGTLANHASLAAGGTGGRPRHRGRAGRRDGHGPGRRAVRAARRRDRRDDRHGRRLRRAHGRASWCCATASRRATPLTPAGRLVPSDRRRRDPAGLAVRRRLGRGRLVGAGGAHRRGLRAVAGGGRRARARARRADRRAEPRAPSPIRAAEAARAGAPGRRRGRLPVPRPRRVQGPQRRPAEPPRRRPGARWRSASACGGPCA